MPVSLWRHPGVPVGFLGAVLVGTGACSNGFSFHPGGWGVGPIAVVARAVDRSNGNLLVLVGCLVLSIAWLSLVPRAGQQLPGRLWLVWGAPLLLVPPVMSGDPFLYADLGWILASGGNPYLDVLGSFGGPFAPFVDDFWAGHGVAYPPLALEVNRLAALLGGMHPYWGVVAQRVPAVLGVWLIARFLPDLADRVGADRQWALWLGVLNPITIVHLIGGAHNDTLMAGVVVFALWVSVQKVPRISPGLVLAPVLIGLAMALKQQAGLAVVAAAGLPVAAQLAGLPRWQRITVLGWRTAVAALLALSTFAVISLGTGLGFGWTLWLTEMGRARTLTLSVAIGDALAWTGTDFTAPANTLIGVLAVGGLAALLVLHPERPMLAAAWGSLLVLFIGQALHPWYVGLSLALLALLQLTRTSARWVVFGTVGYLIAYCVNNLYNMPVLPSVAAGVLAGTLAFALWVGRGERPTRLG